MRSGEKRRTRRGDLGVLGEPGEVLLGIGEDREAALEPGVAEIGELLVAIRDRGVLEEEEDPLSVLHSHERPAVRLLLAEEEVRRQLPDHREHASKRAPLRVPLEPARLRESVQLAERSGGVLRGSPHRSPRRRRTEALCLPRAVRLCGLLRLERLDEEVSNELGGLTGGHTVAPSTIPAGSIAVRRREKQEQPVSSRPKGLVDVFRRTGDDGTMRNVLVTGANKGIGLAIVQAILDEHPDAFVYIASRDAARGADALASLVAGHPAWWARAEVIAVDVADERSVKDAARGLAARGVKLYGLVNNAGIADGTLAEILRVNVLGVRAVCEAFLPLLDPASGRIVNVTSAAGPTLVASSSAEMQRFFLDSTVTWSQIQELLDACIATDGVPAELARLGVGDSHYGISKALANSYTMLLAREHAGLRINACTPGFIETDLSRHLAASYNKSPTEMGMKPPAAGARAPLFLLFGELDGNGHFYGSDSKRSPLDRYRAPGSPAYDGP